MDAGFLNHQQYYSGFSSLSSEFFFGCTSQTPQPNSQGSCCTDSTWLVVVPWLKSQKKCFNGTRVATQGRCVSNPGTEKKTRNGSAALTLQRFLVEGCFDVEDIYAITWCWIWSVKHSWLENPSFEQSHCHQKRLYLIPSYRWISGLFNSNRIRNN